MSANKFANIFEDKQQHDGQYDKQENELIQQSQQKNPVITDYHDATDPATGKPIPRAIVVDDPELTGLARKGRYGDLLRHPVLTKHTAR